MMNGFLNMTTTAAEESRSSHQSLQGSNGLWIEHPRGTSLMVLMVCAGGSVWPNAKTFMVCFHF